MTEKTKTILVFGEGLALLIGTIIGAGFLVLPYTALKAGIVSSLIWFLIFTAAVTLLHLMYGEIVLAGGSHRLPGYAKKYLGRWGGYLANSTFVTGVFGGLLVYLLLGGRFLHLLIGEDRNISPTTSTVLFWLIFSILILAKLKLSGRVNLAITITTTAILVLLSTAAATKIDFRNFLILPSESFFFPFGIVLFSLVGYIAIPEIHALLEEESKPRSLLVPIIVSGTLLVSLLSALFMIAILGVTGAQTSRSAISGLEGKLLDILVLTGILLAFLELATSYLIFGISILHTLEKDFDTPPAFAAAAVVLLPILFYFSGITNFVLLIAVLGSVWVSVDSVLITLIYSRLPQRQTPFLNLPNWVLSLTVALFVVGATLSLIYTI